MSGAGHMLHTIKTLKQNRALLKNKRAMNKKGKASNSYSETKLEFKKVSPAELAKLKEEIRARARKSRIREIVIMGISFLIVIVLLYWMFTS